jgi:hypothetical protein
MPDEDTPNDDDVVVAADFGPPEIAVVAATACRVAAQIDTMQDGHAKNLMEHMLQHLVDHAETLACWRRAAFNREFPKRIKK